MRPTPAGRGAGDDELIVNMRTARALGLTIPQAVLLRADEIVDA